MPERNLENIWTKLSGCTGNELRVLMGKVARVCRNWTQKTYGPSCSGVPERKLTNL